MKAMVILLTLWTIVRLRLDDPRVNNADVARVCTYLSDHKVNVLDISQTIIDGFFNMMMIVDYSGADNEFGVIVEDLDKLGEQIGVRIRCQREEIFTKMHRV